MAVENLTATERGGRIGSTHGLGGTVKRITGTVEVTAAATNASTYNFGRIPSNARIHGSSKIFSDDLASTGAPTLDVGLFAVNGNITSDDDALNDGIDAAVSNATGTALIKDIANYGKKAWEFVNGQTADPGGYLDVKVTIQDAATNTGGTITVQLDYSID